jgi:hypothetical protein
MGMVGKNVGTQGQSLVQGRPGLGEGRPQGSPLRKVLVSHWFGRGRACPCPEMGREKGDPCGRPYKTVSYSLYNSNHEP